MTSAEELADTQLALKLVDLLIPVDDHGKAAREDGYTARELEALTGGRKRNINRVLYRYSPPFVCLDESPPLWFVDLDELDRLPADPGDAATEPDDPHLQRPTQSLPDYSDLTLREWQWDALFAWKENDLSGIVEAVTGAGKTRLAIAAILFQLDVGGRVVVAVPSKELMYQWHRELHDWFGDFEIGLLGGEDDSVTDCDIVVAIVNRTGRQWISEEPTASCLLPTNATLWLTSSSSARRALRRSVGVERHSRTPDGAHEEVLVPYFDGVVFELGYEQAKDEGVIAP